MKSGCMRYVFLIFGVIDFFPSVVTNLSLYKPLPNSSKTDLNHYSLSLPCSIVLYFLWNYRVLGCLKAKSTVIGSLTSSGARIAWGSFESHVNSEASDSRVLTFLFRLLLFKPLLKLILSHFITRLICNWLMF